MAKHMFLILSWKKSHYRQWFCKRTLQDTISNMPIRSFSQVNSIPIHIRRWIAARTRTRVAAPRIQIEVVWTSASTASHQRFFTEPCNMYVPSQLIIFLLNGIRINSSGPGILLTEAFWSVGEPNSCSIVVGIADLGVRVLFLELLQCSMKQLVVVPSEAIELLQASVCVVVLFVWTSE